MANSSSPQILDGLATGYVGEVAAVRDKVSVAAMSVQKLVDCYEEIDVCLEAVSLSPTGGGTLSAKLFGSSSSHSEDFSFSTMSKKHLFDIQSESVVELKKFLRLMESAKEAMTKSFQAYVAASDPALKSEYPRQEIHDRKIVANALMAFGPLPTVVAEECTIVGEDTEMPHGNVDLVVGSVDIDQAVVIVQFSDSISCSKEHVSDVNGVTVKTEVTMSHIASDRQAILEVLAFCETLTLKKGGHVCMIKANRKEIQPYIYFPDIDVLLRTERALKYGPPESAVDNRMEGTLTLYMLLNGMIRPKACSFFESAGVKKCGWKEALSESRKQYVKGMKIPVKRRNTAATKKIATVPPTETKRKVTMLFDQDIESERKRAKLDETL